VECRRLSSSSSCLNRCWTMLASAAFTCLSSSPPVSVHLKSLRAQSPHRLGISHGAAHSLRCHAPPGSRAGLCGHGLRQPRVLSQARRLHRPHSDCTESQVAKARSILPAKVSPIPPMTRAFSAAASCRLLSHRQGIPAACSAHRIPPSAHRASAHVHACQCRQLLYHRHSAHHHLLHRRLILLAAAAFQPVRLPDCALLRSAARDAMRGRSGQQLHHSIFDPDPCPNSTSATGIPAECTTLSPCPRCS
jgi:hypothetical protein